MKGFRVLAMETKYILLKAKIYILNSLSLKSPLNL